VQSGFVAYFFHLTHAHVQPLSSSPWHEGWESPAPRPAPRGGDKCQCLLRNLQLAGHQWCSVHSSSTQTLVQAACCPLVMAACLAHSALASFWSKEDHSCVLLCPGAPGVAAPAQSLWPVVWVHYRALSLFSFLSAVRYLPTHAAHLNALPTSIH